MERRFERKYKFPGVIGCIDGTQIGIFPPSTRNTDYPEFLYVNRKGFHAINTQIVSRKLMMFSNLLNDHVIVNHEKKMIEFISDSGSSISHPQCQCKVSWLSTRFSYLENIWDKNAFILSL